MRHSCDKVLKQSPHIKKNVNFPQHPASSKSLSFFALRARMLRVALDWVPAHSHLFFMVPFCGTYQKVTLGMHNGHPLVESSHLEAGVKIYEMAFILKTRIQVSAINRMGI